MVAAVSRLPGYVAEAHELREFLEAGLHADPPPTGLAEECFSLSAQEFLEAVAVDLAADHWTAAVIGPAAGIEAIPAELGRNAVYEVLAATAACVAHERNGEIVIDGDEAEEAARRVSDFAAASGFGTLVRVFCAMAAFENLQAVEFHNPMPEQMLLTGVSHRPWAAYPLHDDLLMAVAGGMVRIELGSGRERQVWITPHGRAVLAELRARLDAAGVLAWRRRQLAVYHRNWLALEPGVDTDAERRQAWEEILDAAGIGPGGRVLVLGLASGADAFLHELALRVGTGGEVLVVDPAVAVLRRLSPLVSPSAAIRLIPGRFEALPLSDGSADACLAPPFLHIAEHDGALAELRRVVRSGGRVVLGVPHAMDAGHALLREWLEPLLDLAARLEVSTPEAGHGARQAGEALCRQGFRDFQVRPHGLPWSGGSVRGALLQILHGSELGRRVLERTPWRQRHDLLHHLLLRGEQVLSRAESGGSAVLAAGELVLATVP